MFLKLVSTFICRKLKIKQNGKEYGRLLKSFAIGLINVMMLRHSLSPKKQDQYIIIIIISIQLQHTLDYRVSLSFQSLL